MINELFPTRTARNVFSIDYQKLYQEGYRGLLFDIDNTLVHHQADSTPEVDQLFKKLHRMGFRTLILSNNDKSRVLRFLKNIDALYICDAGKPDPACYRRACRMLGMSTHQVIMIGDQLFTDVRGANRAGIKSILVDFIREDHEKWIGWHRYAEYVVLFLQKTGKAVHFPKKIRDSVFGKLIRREILFCEIGPAAYSISLEKEILKRWIHDFWNQYDFAEMKSREMLPFVASCRKINMIRKSPGIDPELQKNKAVNIGIASRKIDGLIIAPGEVFSFWRTVGPPTVKRGYRDGRVIRDGKLVPGPGGGLCNLANILLLLVLDSPLTVTELHTHSDALAPDEGKRQPFSSGTSVSYNNIDFRFRNNTEQMFQFVICCVGEMLYAQLRCEHAFPYRYRLTEENHHFRKEGDRYYRVSKIYHETYNTKTGRMIRRKLLRDNHSEVMYDPALIPRDLIWD